MKPPRNSPVVGGSIMPFFGILMLLIVLIILGPVADVAAQAGPIRRTPTADDRAAVRGADADSSKVASERRSQPPRDAGQPEETAGPKAAQDPSEPSSRTPSGQPATKPGEAILPAPDSGGQSSVRPRGAPVLVSLQPKPTSPSPQRRPTQAAERSPSATKDRNRTPERDNQRTSRTPQSSPRRIWPLKADSFSFTQAFGCVPQIGGFYQSDPGCPPNAPVVHSGIDLAAPLGTRFYAAASGWVTEAGLDRAEGLANTRIVVQHDGANRGYATEYLHWIVTFVEVGDYVEAGQPLGEVGSVGYSTGPHLHFSVIKFADGSHIDPLGWLPKDRNVGAYAGLAPNTDRVEFANVNIDIPGYADPSPPPLPKEKRVPASEAKKQDHDSAAKDRQHGARAERKAERDKRQARADKKASTRDDEPEAATSPEPAPTDAASSPKRDRAATREARTRPESSIPTEEPTTAADKAHDQNGRHRNSPEDEPRNDKNGKTQHDRPKNQTNDRDNERHSRPNSTSHADKPENQPHRNSTDDSGHNDDHQQGQGTPDPETAPRPDAKSPRRTQQSEAAPPGSAADASSTGGKHQREEPETTTPEALAAESDNGNPRKTESSNQESGVAPPSPEETDMSEQAPPER